MEIKKNGTDLFIELTNELISISKNDTLYFTKLNTTKETNYEELLNDDIRTRYNMLLFLGRTLKIKSNFKYNMADLPENFETIEQDDDSYDNYINDKILNDNKL